MSVADSISAALLRFGRPMTLRRATLHPDNTTTNQDVTVYGHSTGYAPSSLVQDVTQGNTGVTISNKQIADAGWPGPPAKQDVLIFDGRRTVIQAVEPKYLGSTVLVYQLEVRGA
jgi:hypothetical protein